MQVMLLSDQDLILNYLNGDERAFETLLTRHKTKIYTSIYLFTRDSEVAEDIFQEVFIKIIDTLRKGKYNHEGKFLQWAMRIAYNMCVDQFRKSKRNAQVSMGENFDVFTVIPTGDDNMEQFLIKDQGTRRIQSLVDQLPAEQREVVILRHYADMSFKEISLLTRVSINTALGRMRYALINLRRMMEEKVEVTY
ncbi:MAG: sigma-70 family RNA polymerase sigma factor [Saprospiraceae bacterium]|jgi:RNA polymerase sigma-70 factor (ECF subfamily)|nr:sigma-70 family RNA polymerase sigma factor [Saprospiraceae bacterium]MBK6476981.1 sigma-70 family RNA polymerase sigma factor [Saprospiraceae bacterium]MBK6814720.1 sigma-70 family RNA polymerase sigma factor [Saprospiraceae bacterium]MBK7370110.1 sigma-70 family RNA polymerase sigma factor [Saprospiraceae bacterium]MBK7437814.1 sigma-70 family RNA polymerase sigma factor [Saprospiraceae bacterium]